MRRHSLPQQMHSLEDRRYYLMRKGRVESAQRMYDRLQRAKSAMKYKQMKRLEREKKKERRAITVNFCKELQAVQNRRKEHLNRLKECEMLIMLSFKQYQKREKKQAMQKLKRRCESERSRSPSSRTQELAKIQQLMIKLNDFRGLAFVQAEAKKEMVAEAKRRQAKVACWTRAEEQRLKATEVKKKSALVSRLEEFRQDKEKLYLREQQRLRQKYKNVISKLERAYPKPKTYQ